MSTIAISTSKINASTINAGALQLTRRGKIVVVTAALVAIAFLAIAFSSAGVASGDAGVPTETRTVQVVAGHTLWQIAAEANPDGDIRQTVDEILTLNSLPSASALQLGSEIAVPVY